eukprot:9688927-Ditylum_brightwellii.AAC.1
MQHIKRHQDSKMTRSDNKTTMNKRLSWEAQLNIHANALATKAKKEITAKEIVQLMDKLPACGAHLNLQE